MNESSATPENRPTVKSAQSISVPTNRRGQEGVACSRGESGELSIQSLHIVGLQMFPKSDHVDNTIANAGQGGPLFRFIETPAAFDPSFAAVTPTVELDMVKQKLVRPQFQPIKGRSGCGVPAGYPFSTDIP